MDQNPALAWTETAKRPLEEARHALDEVSHQARHALDEMGNATGPARRSLEQAIAAHPLQAVGLSLALGVFLGWLLKR